MRYRIMRLIVLTGLVILFSVPQGKSAEPTRIRIGYASTSASFASLFVAKEAGLFEKHGLINELLYLQGVQITQVHVAGHLDFSVAGAPLPMQAAVEGADLILVASSMDKFHFKLIVEPGIKSPEDLKNKIIGIARFGSLPDVAIRLVLKQWGMDADKDVKLFQVGRMSDMVAALSGKRIDAAVVSDPTSFQAEKLGMRRLLDMADIDIEFANSAVAVSRAYAKSHRNVVTRFLQAYVEGTQRFMTDREFGIKALRKYTGFQDREILVKTYDLFSSKYLKKVPAVSLKSVESTLAMIADRNPRAKNRKAEEFVDTSFIDELEKTGFIKSVWR